MPENSSYYTSLWLDLSSESPVEATEEMKDLDVVKYRMDQIIIDSE